MTVPVESEHQEASGVATSGPPAPSAESPRHERVVLAWIFGLSALAFWPTLADFPSVWNQSYREHGFFVAALVCWLIWRDGGRIARESRGGAGYLIPLLVGLSGIWLLAAIMGIGVVQQLMLTAIGVGLALAVFGWAPRRRILAIGLTFLLALPIWEFLVPLLQRVTTIASGALTKLAGIEAVVGEDYIQITTGTFLVEGGCAGLNYLLGGLVLGAFYAHLFVDRWQTQLKIVALAGAVSIVGNWIRVTVLIFLGEATAMQSPYIEDHLWQGWAIFTALMIPTYLLATRIEERDRRRHAADAGAGAGGEVRADAAAAGDADTAGGRTGDSRRTRRASLAALAAVSGPLLFMLIGAVPRGSQPTAELQTFGLLESWVVTDSSAVAPWRPDFVGVDREVAWTLSNGVDSLSALRLYYLDQRQGEELIQWRNVIAPDSMVVDDRVIGPFGESGRFLREALVRTEAEPRVVWYWYRVAGFDTAFSTKAKLLEILAFFGRSGAAELVSLSAACAPDDCREAANVLREAIGARPLPPPESASSGRSPAGAR